LNTFVISLLKLYNSLEENVHILNKTSQNINNTKKINVNEKTYSYSEDKNKLSGNIIKKFTKMMKTTSKDKHIVKHNFFFKTLQNMFVIFVKKYVLCTKSNIGLNHI